MLKGLFDSGYKELKRVEKIANKIDDLAEEYKKLSDEELQAKTVIFRERLKNGEKLEDIQIEAFATVREASTRVLKMTPFKVQIEGALALHGGNVAEMKTGEGKTLTSTMVAYLNALPGEGVHIVTVNEYLASRDAQEMGELFKWLGLTVGLNLRALSKEEKQEQYKCDIMYSISSELGFDYLRDHMVWDKKDLTQRTLNFAIIDEADSVLIDEARTPLIISGPAKVERAQYIQADAFVKSLKGRTINDKIIDDEEIKNLDLENEEVEYIVDVKTKHVILTDKGASRAETRFGLENIYDVENVTILHLIHNSLRANYIMKKGVDYVVQDKKVIIIDQFTGRLMPGRQFSEGLHQALEAKEKVTINKETRTVATITIQNFFRMYKKLAGMTGTAKTEEEEFRDIYNMYVVEVPTNEPMIRVDAPDYLFLTREAKFEALANDIRDRHKKGQPVLVGTASDDMSIKVANMLRKKGITRFQVLNAKNNEKEAQIVAKAGEIGAITIATNMAGRGTDIKLSPGVEELGGLAVLGTERHESRRIDNQLRGRSGRQGNPGYSRFYISTEDDLLVRFGAERFRSAVGMLINQKGEGNGEVPLEYNMFSKFVERAQKHVEGNNFDSRKTVLEYDEVLRKQREVIYGQREKILENDNLDDIVIKMLNSTSNRIVYEILGSNKRNDRESCEQLCEELDSTFLPVGAVKVEEIENKSTDDIVDVVLSKCMRVFEAKKNVLAPEDFTFYLRYVLLRSISNRWLDHIDEMEELRQNVRMQSYAQKNPLREYQEEGFERFNNLLDNIEMDVAKIMNRSRINITIRKQDEQMTTGYANDGGQKVHVQAVSKKIDRNAPCPCGSGLKYKKCCGKNE